MFSAHRIKGLPALVVVLLIVSLLGCKASEAPDSGYLSAPERMVPDEALPFHRTWYRESLDWDRFTELYVDQVHTGLLRDLDWWEGASLRGDAADDVEEIAGYLRRRILEAFEEDEARTLVPVQDIGDGTLVLELALVELVPTKAWLNSLSVPLVGALDYGTVAIEGRLRDGRSGEVVAMFKDREQGAMSLISVADLTWYSHAYHIIDAWADQMVRTVNAGEGDVVEDTEAFTLRPW